jgi:hypothetical protein
MAFVHLETRIVVFVFIFISWRLKIQGDAHPLMHTPDPSPAVKRRWTTPSVAHTFPVLFRYELKASIKSCAGTSFTDFPLYVVVTSAILVPLAVELTALSCT